MSRFPHESIERKWQQRWEQSGAHHADLSRSERKQYVLVMFSYPSGDKLHIGHWYNFAPTDSWARFRRMQGYHVFEPMGFDAFGLPAENQAIKTGVHPAESTAANVRDIRTQLRSIGAMYDWAREVDTSQPEYYKWTQWLFLKLYEHGLAYRDEAPVNWCPDCKTVLANEDVHDGACWRCDSEVTRRNLEQWFFRITRYADQLLDGLEGLDWPEGTLAAQREWIGRSEGAEIVFELEAEHGPLRVFTTRPDTLFGVSYLVLAPEHPLVERICSPQQASAVQAYVERTRKVSELERTFRDRAKTGVFTGAYARHPLSGQRLPIWIGDYVLMGYGTGAIMAVPAHDERDWEFARAYELPIMPVIEPPAGESVEGCYPGHGRMVNSDEFTGSDSVTGGRRIAELLSERGAGGPAVSYRMRDWLVSRQRYWGAPIPMVHCADCGWLPVPESELPVLLPRDVQFEPDGRSPLERAQRFICAKCPECGAEARRETDTMDTFVDSSWYYLRYLSADRDDVAWDPEVARAWMPVDQYVGGPEHARGHLLFARFINRALHDFGLVPTAEPFSRLRHQGIILNQGQRMSKSKGNSVVPDEFVRAQGADTFRMYLMFMGSYEQGGEWSDQGLMGMRRFLDRIWRLVRDEQGAPVEGQEATESIDDRALRLRMHQTIQAVTRDLERFSFNTCIARLMELTSACEQYCRRPQGERDAALEAESKRTLIRLLAPFAPHLGEELWELMEGQGSVFDSGWPQPDESVLSQRTLTIVVQVNGKLRSRIEAAPELPREQLEQLALADEKVKEHLGSKSVRRVIVIPNRLVNIVVS